VDADWNNLVAGQVYLIYRHAYSEKFSYIGTFDNSANAALQASSLRLPFARVEDKMYFKQHSGEISQQTIASLQHLYSIRLSDENVPSSPNEPEPVDVDEKLKRQRDAYLREIFT
jgi:hypothetical protein